MREVFYITKEERRDAILLAEAAGETMISDDFRVGPDDSNRLIFDIRVDEEPIPLPERVRIKELQSLLAQTKNREDAMSLPELMELLRLERGL